MATPVDRWRVYYEDEAGKRNVVPLDDIKDHSLFVDCECHPSAERLDFGVVLIAHNSFDGREFTEPDYGDGVVRH